MNVITRTQAREAGLKHFYSGRTCPRGHSSLRYVSTGNCCECNRENSRVTHMTEEQRLRRNELFVASPNARQNWRNFYLRNSKEESIRARENQVKRMQRVPAWSESEQIKQFYLDCPDGYEVDHVLPLQGKSVSGLHVISNLQYLPILENRRKGNRS